MNFKIKDGSIIDFRKNQLAAIVDHRLKSLKLKEKCDWQNITVVFIISTGRTGTHFFSHFFNNNFNKTFAVHEPKTDIFDLNVHYLKKWISHKQAKYILEYSRQSVYKHLKKEEFSNYIESNNNLSYLIPVLQDYFDKYKIIHIVRNGKDVVRSLYSHITRGKWVGNTYFMSDKDPRSRINSNILPEDEYYGKWKDMSRFQKTCWYWSRKDEMIRKEVEKDINAKTFLFEDLFIKRDKEKWEELIHFTNLYPFFHNSDINQYIQSKKSNKARKYILGPWEEWSDNLKKEFIHIAGEQMKKYNYPI